MHIDIISHSHSLAHKYSKLQVMHLPLHIIEYAQHT